MIHFFRVNVNWIKILGVLSCPTRWDPMDCRLPGSSVHGILQARILEWVSISFSRGSSQTRAQTQVCYIASRFLPSESPGFNEPPGKVLKLLWRHTHSLVAQRIKNLPAMWETQGSIPWLGRSPGGGNGNPFQYSCLEKPQGHRSLAGYSP